ncbi:MAG: hypothetical protein ABW321_00340 [Polyangiales bacterium]
MTRWLWLGAVVLAACGGGDAGAGAAAGTAGGQAAAVGGNASLPAGGAAGGVARSAAAADGGRAGAAGGQAGTTGGLPAVAGAGPAAAAAGTGAAGGGAGTGPSSGGSGGAAPGGGAAGAAGADSAGPGAGGAGGSAATAAPTLPAVTSTSEDGPFEATQDSAEGPSRSSVIFRPSELGKDGLRHPVFVWGGGGSSTPASYADQLLRIASHGFIVIADVSTIGDDGAPLTAAIDWIIAESERAGSVFQGVVATDKVAVGGHSIGSANTFFMADDPRITTTIHVAGGSLDDVNDPFAETTGMGGKGLVHPVAYICSMSDTFRNVEKSEKDYNNTSVPAWMTVMTGIDHVGAARAGLPATIAWLRWHLAGETDRRSAFLDEGGEFTSGIFVSRNKNW